MLIIFDCDGVLRSFSWEGTYAAYVAIAEHFNLKISDFWPDVDSFRKKFDNNWHSNLAIMGITDKKHYPIINDIFHSIYDPLIYKFPWVDEMAKQLSQKHSLAVFTSSISKSAYDSLEESSRYFSHIIGSSDVENIKPDPEGVNLIIEKLGADKKEVIMIGDSSVDILAGKKAGITTAGVAWGMMEEKELEKFKPDIMFHDPEELKFLN